MNVLVDTNLLTRWVNAKSISHQIAVDSLKILRTAGHTPTLVPQNLYEFWVVATRPRDSNGFGMTPHEVATEFERMDRLFSLMLDERAILPRWQELVRKYEVCGKPAHDARLVAAMLRHGLTHLLTFDSGGFQRYQEIATVTPEGVVADGATAFANPS